MVPAYAQLPVPTRGPRLKNVTPGLGSPKTPLPSAPPQPLIIFGPCTKRLASHPQAFLPDRLHHCPPPQLRPLLFPISGSPKTSPLPKPSPGKAPKSSDSSCGAIGGFRGGAEAKGDAGKAAAPAAAGARRSAAGQETPEGQSRADLGPGDNQDAHERRRKDPVRFANQYVFLQRLMKNVVWNEVLL